MHQVEYCHNFIFRRNHPIRKLFDRSCELGMWRLTGDRIQALFGRRSRERLSGKLQTILERVEQGQHVFRAYWKHAFVKQYEKYRTFLRNEVTTNNLSDFGLKKGLAHLGEVRTRLLGVLDRYAEQEAETLNVHEDFALLQRIALPVQNGAVRTPGIRVQDRRIIRLLEVLLHAATQVGGWTAKQIYAEVLDRFELSPQNYGLAQLCYDLRKLKGHGLTEREPKRYAYRLSAKGQSAAVLLLLFHRRLCGPLAGTHLLRRPVSQHCPKPSKLEAAYYRADRAIDNVIAVLKAA